MRRSRFAAVGCVVLAVGLAAVAVGGAGPQEEAAPEEEAVPPAAAPRVELPEPVRKGTMSLEEAIQKRRSVRQYAERPLTLAQLSQLLWSANGVTGNNPRFRAAPSAGALHPLDFYAVVGQGMVEGLEAGVWHYEPAEHALTRVLEGDHRQALASAALGQRQITTASVVIVVTAEYARSTGKYSERGQRYALLDAGFAAENLCLQVQSLNLAVCIIGAFRDASVTETLRLPKAHEPLLFLTVGHPRAD